ncbi:TATA box-binding protein-associated factor RNA polymerase I subunit D [Spea bombifrons]|uniref:TATA box-binding protein-associated factor RNA polymerase I subunit D n=1 Tax=Spea bombifrons TaxID=233779 RepID=UPI00234BC4C2|nr:TATA box-binding protein-associated factor RNA polymerase I subunit D [Spea bombifrons]
MDLIENTTENTDPEFPQSQELFSDPNDSFQGETSSTQNVATLSKDQDSVLTSDSSGSGDSLFETQIACTPTRTQRRAARSYSPLTPSDDSSDYEPIPKKLTVREIVQNYFQKKKRKRKKKKKKQTRKPAIKTREKNPYKKRPISLEERKRRLRHKGIEFPFRNPKFLPFKMYYTYEKFVVGAFLHYLEILKSENHLLESLKKMNASDHLSNESFEMQRYKYLDDDGPISPISESAENVNCDQEPEEYDAQIVENNCFVLSSKVPNDNDWCITKESEEA